MTRTAILHLGMNKTGTSSIQQTFAEYSDDDWRYLQLGPPNHSAILALAFLDRPPRHIQNSLALDAPGLTPTEAREMIRSELRRDSRSVVLSAEGLAKKYWAGSARTLTDFLGGHVDRVRGLAYVRDPVGFVSSVFQQVVRQKLPPSEPGELLPRYRAWFEPWVGTLGRDNLSFIPFARAHFAQGDLLVDFARRAGLDAAYARSHATHDNTSLSAEATALIYAMHLRLDTDRLQGGRLAAARRLGAIMRGFGSRKFAFSVRALAPALDRAKADIAWIERQMETAFPPPDMSGRLVFDSAGALLDLAAEQGPALARHLTGAGQDPVGAEADPVGAMVRLLETLAEPVRPGMAHGATGAEAAWADARGHGR